MRPKILSRKIKYRGLWAEIEEAKIRLSDGKIVRWETIIAPDAVVIVPIDKEKNIYLVKEWRATWEKEILQVPAGTCKGKTKKEILKQANNELREEVGLGAKKWKKL
ncbi:ADP-ribose pyrophosphatase, partial [Patescibacteria group bacterium]|nr:ADP-ribose pyrophosphatase [Patescibacteria group bacterium]